MSLNWTVRQPILLRGGLALLVMGAARVGVALDWIPAEWQIDEHGVEQLFDGLVAAWSWFSTHRVVTPVAAPRADDGRQLVAAAGKPYPMP